MALTLTTTAFRDSESIPAEFTCDGADRSPELRWTGAPAGTRSFALIVHDPDAPRGDFTHWVLYNIPADILLIPEGVETSAIGDPGTNDFDKRGYGGPCPPSGHGRHRYYFTLYALDIGRLPAEKGAKRAEVEAEIEGRVLGQARLMGVYERR